jgi:hypothetical protein
MEAHAETRPTDEVHLGQSPPIGLEKGHTESPGHLALDLSADIELGTFFGRPREESFTCLRTEAQARKDECSEYFHGHMRR